VELNLAPAEEAVAHNVRRLSVRQLDQWRFRSGGTQQAPGPQDRIFGGTLLAQGSLAAARTVRPDMAQHSLHAYFVKSGSAGAPVEYAVEPVRDGGTFVSRRVTALDGDDVLCEMLTSFTAAGESAPDNAAMPDAPPPDDMEPLPPPPPDGGPVMIPFEVRHAPVEKGNVDFMWARLRAPLPDDALVHRTWLVNMSDMFSTARTPNNAPMTLDYALWLHGDCRLDGWMLLATKRMQSDSTRSMVSRQIFVQGRLAATMAQEAFARPPRS
jgi:acyl-CoA thioesterase-2